MGLATFWAIFSQTHLVTLAFFLFVCALKRKYHVTLSDIIISERLGMAIFDL
jgi:hypothetical protein